MENYNFCTKYAPYGVQNSIIRSTRENQTENYTNALVSNEKNDIRVTHRNGSEKKIKTFSKYSSVFGAIFSILKRFVGRVNFHHRYRI